MDRRKIRNGKKEEQTRFRCPHCGGTTVTIWVGQDVVAYEVWDGEDILDSGIEEYGDYGDIMSIECRNCHEQCNSWREIGEWEVG